MNFLDGRRRGWWASGAGQSEENEMVDKMFNVKQNKRGSYGFLNTISTFVSCFRFSLVTHTSTKQQLFEFHILALKNFHSCS